jgi:hypothetical protein
MGNHNKYQRKASKLRQSTGGKFGKKQQIAVETVNLVETEVGESNDNSQEEFIFSGVKSFMNFNYRGPKTVVNQSR